MARKRTPGAATLGERPFHHIQTRAFCHATEQPELVKRAVARVAGFDLHDAESEKRFTKTLKDIGTEGHYHNPIRIYELEVTRSAEVRRFWKNLLRDRTVRARLEDEVDGRLDDDLVFWIRFDKQAAAQGALRLGEGQDVIQVRAKLATYPKDRAVGLDFLRGFLSDEGKAEP